MFKLDPTDLLTLADCRRHSPNFSSFPGLYSFTAGTFSFGIGPNDDRGTASNTYQWGDSWSMAVGKHNFHAGGDPMRYQLNRNFRFSSQLPHNRPALYTLSGVPAHIYFSWLGPGLGIGSRLCQCESPTAGRDLPIRFCQTLLRPLLALDRFSGSHTAPAIPPEATARRSA